MRAVRRTLCLALLAALIAVFACGLLSAAEPSENIARGMSYVFATGQPTVHSYDRYDGSFDNDRGQLTNGVYAEANTKALGWLPSFRSSSRTVTFDFGEQVTVTGMAADFLHDPSNYHAPRETSLYLSDNGNDWFLAGTVCPDFPLASSTRRYTAKLETKPYLARFVRVEYTVDVYALCDEIEIYGSKTKEAGAASVVPDDPEPSYFCASLGSRTDITDIIKIYNGYYPANQAKANNTPEELLPYVAYLAADGTIEDTMFDAVAFVPCVATDFGYPSGGTLVRKNNMPSAVLSDWVYYTDFLFAEGLELDALNRTVETVYTALGKDADAKFPVLFTMHYPNVSSKPFGDLDGDGVDEYTRTTAERVAVIEWYDRYLSERFAKAGFDRLEFVGWYWYNETIDEAWNADEKAFTEQAVAALRANGREVLYDPYYLSLGYDRWQEYGFSAAVMQPNVSFLASRPYFELEMLDEFAVAIGRAHLGVEVETDEPSTFRGDDPSRPATYYERYLFVGAKTGYMNALHTFYQGAGPGSIYDFAHATGKTPSEIRLRRLYDITYRFVKGVYANEPPAVSVPERVTAEPGSRVKFDIAWTDEDSYPGDVQVTLSEPAHGTAQLAMNRKTVSYVPAEGFTGTETLVITVSDGQNEAREYSVPVTVGVEPDSSGTVPEESVPGGTEPGSGEDGSRLYWVIGIAAAVVIAASAAVIAIVLKKNRS